MDAETGKYLQLATQAHRVLIAIDTPELPPVFYESVAQLGQLLTATRGEAVAQHMTYTSSASLGAQKAALREAVRERYCRVIIGISRALLREHPGMIKMYRMPYQRLGDLEFVTHASAMLDHIRGPDREVFARHGITDEFLQRFEETVERFYELSVNRQFTRVKRAGTTVGLGVAAQEAQRLLTLIDAHLYPHLLDHPEALELWQKVCPPSRKLGGKRGRSRLALGTTDDSKHLISGRAAPHSPIGGRLLAAFAESSGPAPGEA